MGGSLCRSSTVADKETIRNTLQNRNSFMEEHDRERIYESEENIISLIQSAERPRQRRSTVKFADLEFSSDTNFPESTLYMQGKEQSAPTSITNAPSSKLTFASSNLQDNSMNRDSKARPVLPALNSSESHKMILRESQEINLISDIRCKQRRLLPLPNDTLHSDLATSRTYISSLNQHLFQ